MSDYSQDDLNAFFKGKLENVDTDDGNMWNVPPDFVFDNAINKVNALQSNKSSDKKSWLLLLLIPIGMVIGMYFINNTNLQKINDRVESLESEVFQNKNQIVNLENEIAIQKVDFSRHSKESSQTVKTDIQNQETVVLSDNRKNLSYDLDVLNEKRIAHKSDDNKSFNKDNLKESKESISKKYKNERNSTGSFAKLSDNNGNSLSAKKLNIRDTDNLSTMKNNKLKSIDKNAHINLINFMPSLDSNKLFVNNKHSKVFKSPELVSNLHNDSRNNSFNEAVTYGVFVKQNYSSLNVKGMSDDVDLTSFDNRYSGIGINFQIQKSISKRFDMQFSLGYDVINNNSTMSETSFYNTDNETELPNGKLKYSMNIEVETPFGAINAPTNFVLEQNSAMENDKMDQLTETTQSLNVVSLNVGPKFKLIDSKQWEVFSTASLGYNRIVSYKSEISTSVKMNDKTMVEFRARQDELYDINRNFLSAQLGLGLGFKFSEKVQLAMSANYGRSLNSLRVSKSISDPTTYLTQWNSQIGLNFSF